MSNKTVIVVDKSSCNGCIENEQFIDCCDCNKHYCQNCFATTGQLMSPDWEWQGEAVICGELKWKCRPCASLSKLRKLTEGDN